MDGGLAVPDRFVAPVRRRRCGRLVRRTRRVRIAHDQFDAAGGIRLRIDHRQIVATLFERAVDRTVGIDRRIPLVARDLVVQIRFGIRPVPHRDHHVSLASLRAIGCGRRQLAGGDPVGPVRVHPECALTADLREARAHTAARLAGLNPLIPRALRIWCGIEDALGNAPRGGTAHLMAPGAAVGVDDLSDPFALAPDARSNAVAFLARARKIAHRRHLHQGEPELRGVILRGGLLVGRSDGLQVDDLSGRRFRLRRVDETVATHPHVVLGARQIGDDKTSLVVGHDALDQARGKVRRLGDHPDASFRSASARDDSTNVVVVDGDRSAAARRLTRADEHKRRDTHCRQRQRDGRPPRTV